MPSKQTVYGRETVKDLIITQLLDRQYASSSQAVSVLPIVGIGGVGKTTLARLVYNHKRVKEHFDTRIWVCVSDNFDVVRLTREMLQYMCVPGLDRVTNLNRLQELLAENLWSQRFLLVLDDVWNDSERDKWDMFCAPLEFCNAGSRVLMTTRLDGVVSIVGDSMDVLERTINLKGLPVEEYLPLFNKCAFGDEDPEDYPELVRLGRQIARKLKGSPLAAKTVGGLLRENLDGEHWRIILCSDIWELPQSPCDIMPVLRLSYQHLPVHLQQCFAYCSVFPKDWVFESDKLIAMWISHGYIQTDSRGNKRLEDIGREYFNNLLSRSFFEKNEGWGDIRYVVHDLLHDLAESISADESFRINANERKEIPKRVRHLCAHPDTLVLLCTKGILRNLRTLIIFGDQVDDYTALEELLNGLKSIRVVSFVTTLEHFPDNISHLIHLRYLDIEILGKEGLPDSLVPSMPNSLCKLYHVQWMGFLRSYFPRGGGNVTIPTGITNLINLRHFFGPLKMLGTVPGIGKLSSLQELESFTIKKEEGRRIGELQKLNELGGSLKLYEIDNVFTEKEALEAELNKKVRIQKLDLSCSSTDRTRASPETAEEVFEGLHPPPYIKELTLRGYYGAKSPTWMIQGNQCLSYLESLFLLYSLAWKDLPPLGQLPVLRRLVISEAHSLAEIGSAFYGTGDAKGFPCLEIFEIGTMSQLVAWSGVEGVQYSAFPRLHKLKIRHCHKLEQIPLQDLTSLQELEILSCSNLVSLLVELKNLPSLKKLAIGYCCELQSLPLLPTSLVMLTLEDCSDLLTVFTMEPEVALSKLTSLEELHIKCCPRFLFMSAELRMIPSLKKLTIEECDMLESLPLLPYSIEALTIKRCFKLLSLFTPETQSDLTSLQKLHIEHCPLLQPLPQDLLGLPSLKKLTIEYCDGLRSLPLLPTPLEVLVIKGCTELLTLITLEQKEKISDLNSLRKLKIEGCPHLLSIPSELKLLPSLQMLTVDRFPDPQSLPVSLDELYVYGYPEELPQERFEQIIGVDWHSIFHIPKLGLHHCRRSTKPFNLLLRDSEASSSSV